MTSDWARPVVHWSIVAIDPERQRDFYSALFN
jgi:predicted enzyme related to lactoylglutathione lyase